MQPPAQSHLLQAPLSLMTACFSSPNITPLRSEPSPTPAALENSSLPSFCTILSLSTPQVRNELQKIKVQKVTGPVGISSRLLKCSTDHLCGIREYIFNKSEAGDDATAMEDFLCGTNGEDHSSEGSQQLQAGSTNLKFDED